MLFVVRPIPTERAPLAGLRRWSPQSQQVPLTSQFSDTRVLPRLRVLDRGLVDVFRDDHGLIGKEFHDILHPSNRMWSPVKVGNAAPLLVELQGARALRRTTDLGQ